MYILFFFNITFLSCCRWFFFHHKFLNELYCFFKHHVSTELGDRKKIKAHSDKLIDGPPSTHAKRQDSITTDSGLSISSGFGPLHIACVRGHKDTVNALIQNGASINAWDKDGKTPLYRSCENGHLEIVQLLLNKGVYVNFCDKDGFSPLYAACQEDHHDIVKLLLDNKADPNMMSADDTVVQPSSNA